jgi:hypothetical protein
VTVNGYTRDEDFGEAVLVVSELGDPGRPPIEVLANRGGAARAPTSRSRICAPAWRETMTGNALPGELVVRTIAETAIDNEKYFGDLDAVVGDGDFGYSLARGFEKVLEAGTASTAATRDVPEEAG